MTRDGKIITLPKYGYIEAIGYDTYIGSVDGGNRVVIKTN